MKLADAGLDPNQDTVQTGGITFLSYRRNANMAKNIIPAGRRISDDTARSAGNAAIAGAARLANNAYKLSVIETLV